MINYKKQNLVIVHSFPTNSILLSGLKDFLQEFFNVYFVDLPGFNNNFDAKRITLDNYSKFLFDEIERYKLESYWLGGVSFGFLIAHKIKINDKCKGFFAIEPFIGVEFLRQKRNETLFLKFIFSSICFLGLEKKIYKSRIFKRYLSKRIPQNKIEIMLKTIHPTTFFQTGRLIFNYNDDFRFRELPYILVINPEDDIIQSSEIIKLFARNNCITIITRSDHYPSNPTKEYFKTHIDKTEIEKIINFVTREN